MVQPRLGKTVRLLAAASLVFFAYRGFQNVCLTVEEARNPQRDVPIGILTALFVCTALYLAVSGLLTAIAPYSALNVSSPIAYALLQLGINWGSGLVAVGVIVGLTSTMLVLYYGLTRILFAMARDGLLPSFFSAIDARTQTPMNATILCGIVTSALAGWFRSEPWSSSSTPAHGRVRAVCAGVIVLRRPSLICRGLQSARRSGPRRSAASSHAWRCCSFYRWRRCCVSFCGSASA
jgi:APA family basic amino acid/polyamine antiporter